TGVHVVLTDDHTLLAFAAVVHRALRHGGRVFDTGYVEGVSVRADQQGRGLGAAVMGHAETLIRERHQFGALNAVDSAADFYAHRGWQSWTGHTQALTPTGALVDTYDDADRIYVLTVSEPEELLDNDIPLICDWRDGDLW
ncbi:MAG: GNAT family N-acetyltransferase, partial [Mycobacterium sp.]